MLFNFKALADRSERMWGVLLRIFGVDISILVVGWLDDWMLFDLRFPSNRGLFVQLLGLIFCIGRLPDDSPYRS